MNRTYDMCGKRGGQYDRAEESLYVFQLTQGPTESSVPTLIRRVERQRNSKD